MAAELPRGKLPESIRLYIKTLGVISKWAEIAGTREIEFILPLQRQARWGFVHNARAVAFRNTA